MHPFSLDERAKRKLLGLNGPEVALPKWCSIALVSNPLTLLSILDYSASKTTQTATALSKSNQPTKHQKSPHELRFQIPPAELAAGDGGGAGVHGGPPRRRPFRLRPNPGPCRDPCLPSPPLLTAFCAPRARISRVLPRIRRGSRARRGFGVQSVHPAWCSRGSDRVAFALRARLGRCVG